ncbi:MAG TPA: elongation factor G [Hyphomicrobiaceae bacterium]|nr:elongation factor G [Hyphomicrobiaceae bacterium]
MGQSGGSAARSSRCIALVGPYLSGKTTLLEAILARTGAITRQGKIAEKNTVGDATAEARDHGMTVEVNVADTTFLDDKFTFIDCPGSIEFQYEAALALTGCDAAVVVCEPDPKRVAALQLILKQLEDRNIPRFLFLNKIDSFDTQVRDILPMLQPASAKPLVLRQIPIWENGAASGFVDLALERAFVYRKHAQSEVVQIPDSVKDRETEARFKMLEQLADYDDELMEQLLSDAHPSRDKIFADLVKDLRDGLIVPVLLGSAENGNGILRLLKALRHEAPGVERTAQRLKLENAKSAAQVIKTIYSPHGGKLSVVRVLAGEFGEGTVVHGPRSEERAASAFSMLGQETRKTSPGKPGDTIALGRLEKVLSGETLSADKSGVTQVATPEPPQPVYGVAIGVKDRKDEVKLTGALARLMEEDPSLRLEHAKDTHQMVLWGQGEMHLRVVLERLKRKYGVDAEARRRQVPYKETIRKGVEVRGRHKKQSGGHGQFGDVVLDIKPLPRGTGFQFTDTITGGVVPKQFIPSVEIGVQDFLNRGTLGGFPVVDVAVTLTDGSYHSVDSSDMAFRQAGRIAMADGVPKCSPVLLEPIMEVEIAVPSDATARVNAMIPQRRGQILGFDAREGWPGWDVVRAQIPESEMQDLIVELRSATAGVGTYTAKFHHLAELTGKLADNVLSEHKAAAAAAE